MTDRALVDDELKTLESMANDALDVAVPQLSFDVGGATPDFGTVKLGGSLGTTQALRKGTQLTITVTNDDGQVIAEGNGYVNAVSFKDKRGRFGDIESTERAHAVALG